MEKTLVTILVILALVIGGIGGAVFTPANEIVKEVETITEVPVNVSVIEYVEVEAPSVLDRAIEAFLEAVDDEEDEAGNDVDVLGDYNFDEVEVSKVYDEYSVEYDGDETTVEFEIRLRFKEEDSRAEKETFDVQVIFEDDEETQVVA